jgi:hypothetical protein
MPNGAQGKCVLARLGDATAIRNRLKALRAYAQASQLRRDLKDAKAGELPKR